MILRNPLDRVRRVWQGRYDEEGGQDWDELPVAAGYEDGARGVGIVDFAAGQRRASGELALHVLEVMTGLLTSAAEGTRLAMTTTPALPSIVPFTPRALWRGKDLA